MKKYVDQVTLLWQYIFRKWYSCNWLEHKKEHLKNEGQ